MKSGKVQRFCGQSYQSYLLKEDRSNNSFFFAIQTFISNPNVYRRENKGKSLSEF